MFLLMDGLRVDSMAWFLDGLPVNLSSTLGTHTRSLTAACFFEYTCVLGLTVDGLVVGFTTDCSDLPWLALAEAVVCDSEDDGVLGLAFE